MSLFSRVPAKRHKLTPHRLAHSVKFSTQFGFETPTLVQKAVPGDVFFGGIAQRLDTAALSTKLMQEMRIKEECFFVPTRIMWKQFEDFFVEEENSIVHPHVTWASLMSELESIFPLFFTADFVTAPYSDSLMEFFWRQLYGPKGLLYSVFGDIGSLAYDSSHPIDCLPLYAYFFVMKEYYWDENLQDMFIDYFDPERFRDEYSGGSGDLSLFFVSWFVRWTYYCMSGEWFASPPAKPFLINDDNVASFQFYSRGFVFRNYPKDYFTGSLPWKQKGNNVIIPSTVQSEIKFFIQNDHPSEDDISSGTLNFLKFQNTAQGQQLTGYKQVNPVASVVNEDNQNTYIKGLTAVGTGVTSIEDFRTAYEVQKWLETNARGGTRYKEQILAHFGIKTKDSRLDRPEFMFGYTDVVNHGDVYTTYQDEDGNGVPGEAVTKLTSGGASSRVGYRVSEHGYFLKLYCTYPKAIYNPGLNRQALEVDKFDYFWPEFEHLGEQEVYNCEIDNSSTTPLGVFGYVPRYAQYKFIPNKVMGEFAPQLVNSEGPGLPTFTLSRDFGENTPSLNGRFIMIDPVYNNLNRCFNVVSSRYDKLYPEVYNNILIYRPMSYFGTPRLVL